MLSLMSVKKSKLEIRMERMGRAIRQLPDDEGRSERARAANEFQWSEWERMGRAIWQRSDRGYNNNRTHVASEFVAAVADRGFVAQIAIGV